MPIERYTEERERKEWNARIGYGRARSRNQRRLRQRVVRTGPDGGTGRRDSRNRDIVAVIDPPDGRIPWQPWALAKKNYIRDHPYETPSSLD